MSIEARLFLSFAGMLGGTALSGIAGSFGAALLSAAGIALAIAGTLVLRSTLREALDG